MSDSTAGVEEVIVMEHHDPEEAMTDLSLSVETVLQLSVDQLREKLLELGINPKGRPKPQLQLELLQVLKCEIVVPGLKSTTLEQAQLQLQKEQLQLEMLRLKLKTEADIADRKERVEKQVAEMELQERKDKLEQQRFAAEVEAQKRKEAFEAEMRKEAFEQQRRREDFEKKEQERKELLDTQFRREVAEAAERKERKEAQEKKGRLELESELTLSGALGYILPTYY